MFELNHPLKFCYIWKWLQLKNTTSFIFKLPYLLLLSHWLIFVAFENCCNWKILNLSFGSYHISYFFFIGAIIAVNLQSTPWHLRVNWLGIWLWPGIWCLFILLSLVRIITEVCAFWYCLFCVTYFSSDLTLFFFYKAKTKEKKENKRNRKKKKRVTLSNKKVQLHHSE